MKKYLAIALLTAAGASQSATLDTRLSYDSVAKDYIGRIYVGNTWASGIGGSLEAPFTFTGTKFSGDVDILRTGTTEVVAWWTTPLSNGFFIRPGLSTLVSSAGSTSRPFVTTGYKVNANWDMSVRYRYGHRNYDTLDKNKQLDRDDAHNLTLWTGYKVSPGLTLEYQFDAIQKVNNFNNDNLKKRIYEHEFVALFPDAFGKGVTPYVLIDHLGKSFNTEDKSGKTHWRPRIGLKVVF